MNNLRRHVVPNNQGEYLEVVGPAGAENSPFHTEMLHQLVMVSPGVLLSI